MEERRTVGVLVVVDAVVVVERSARDGLPFLIRLTTKAEPFAVAVGSNCQGYPESGNDEQRLFYLKIKDKNKLK